MKYSKPLDFVNLIKSSKQSTDKDLQKIIYEAEKTKPISLAEARKISGQWKLRYK